MHTRLGFRRQSLSTRTHDRALLAAIARRDWLLQMLALTAASCVGEPDTGEKATLTMSWPAAEWDVLFLDSSSQFLAFLPLVVRNEEGEIEGRLADSWDHSPDYRTWTVRLRRDVRWHDGRPVTAHDIKFTLDLFQHPDVLRAVPDGMSVTVLDDNTYRIAYRRLEHGAASAPLASPLDDYTVYYPRHLLEDLDPKTFRTWAFWNHPVGNGPYRVARHVPQTMLEFEANPDYYRGRPRIERVVLRWSTDAEGEATELLSGTAQAAWIRRGNSLIQLRSDVRFRTYHSVGSHILRTIAWNHRHPLFGDATIRRALTLAIDRRELHQVLNLPDETPVLDGPAPRYVQRASFPASSPYDPARAARLLDEAGCIDGDGDGIRERDGRRFSFQSLTQTESADAAVYVQAALRRAGVDMQIRTMDRSVVLEQLRAGRFEAAFLAVNYGPATLLSWFGPGSLLGYAAGEATSLLNRLQNSTDPSEIEVIYRQLTLIFQRDVPATFLNPNVETMVVSRQVHGLSTPHRADPLRYMGDLWLEE